MSNANRTSEKPIKVVEFSLNSDKPTEIVPKTEIDPEKPTFVITHGFESNGKLNDEEEDDWVKDMADEIRESNPDANIIVVDWQSAAEGKLGRGFYENPARNTQEIGQQLGDYLVDHNINPKNAQLIGHSLGAHVSGAAGERYYERTGEKINGIIGLDPAGPAFQNNDFIDRNFWGQNSSLDSNDAENVVAIHSSEFFGHDSPIGTLDVFVNFSDFNQPDSGHFVSNHGYAHQLFISLLKGNVYKQQNGTELTLESLYTTKGLFNATTRNNGQCRNISGIGKLKFEHDKDNRIGEARSKLESEWESIYEKYIYLMKNHPINRIYENLIK